VKSKRLWWPGEDPFGKQPLGRPRSRPKDNINMDLKEVVLRMGIE
jgi:hypothetical protein